MDLSTQYFCNFKVLIHHPEDQPDPSTKGFAGELALIQFIKHILKYTLHTKTCFEQKESMKRFSFTVLVELLAQVTSLLPFFWTQYHRAVRYTSVFQPHLSSVPKTSENWHRQRETAASATKASCSIFHGTANPTATWTAWRRKS